jgi:hypothetical protein
MTVIVGKEAETLLEYNKLGFYSKTHSHLLRS